MENFAHMSESSSSMEERAGYMMIPSDHTATVGLGEDYGLSPREEEILCLVVQEFIRSGAAVSSLNLCERYELSISSATIRSILADLSRRGLLFAPHRSAGRIPTERGFRFFISRLPTGLPPFDPRQEEQMAIQKEYLRRNFQMQDVLEATCKILSMLTNYAGMIVAPTPEKAILKHIELIDVGTDEILMVILARSGTVYTKNITVDTRVPRGYLQQISRYLNEQFQGLDLRDVEQQLEQGSVGLGGELQQYASLLMKTLAAHFSTMGERDDIIITGLDRVVDEIGTPDLPAARIYEVKDIFRGILRRAVDLDDIAVTIEGDRNPVLSGISILAGSYRMGERRIGAMGIVGPNRMNYHRAIRIIEYLRIITSGMITKMNK